MIQKQNFSISNVLISFLINSGRSCGILFTCVWEVHMKEVRRLSLLAMIFRAN